MPDGFYDTFKVRQHLFISESQDVEAFGFKEGIAILIGLLPLLEIMRLAIEFDDQLDGKASKVGDVVSKWDLPAKAKTINSIGLQVTPQQSFSTRHRSTKLLRPAALALADDCVWHSWLPPSLTLPHKGGGNGESIRSRAGQLRENHELNPPASVGMSSGLKP